MHTYNLIVNQSRDWHEVEHLGELLPKFNRINPFTRIIKPISSVYGLAFMVAPEHEEIFWVFNFIGQQQTYSCNAEISTIDVVTKEQVVGIWWVHVEVKVVEEVFELSVNVA